jgi:hypothetical protein
MTFVELLRALLDRRLFDCLLTPDRSLGTLAEAEAFLRDRGPADAYRRLCSAELV